MVRKTKAEALATRDRIIDAAEHLFQRQGVSGTSLHAIAVAAGLTRGAIYWHFKDKGDLFNAMMQRVCLPIEQSTALLEKNASGQAPLSALRAHMLGIFARIAGDEQARRVFDIATHKVEYVGEMSAVRERHLQGRRDCQKILERLLRAAQRRGDIVQSPPPRPIAIGLHALLDGLIQNWMLDPGAFDLLVVGRQAVDLHLGGLTRHQSGAG